MRKGVIFITVSAKNRPKIKFPLAPTNWNYLIDIKTGEKRFLLIIVH